MVTLVRWTWPGAKEDGLGKAPQALPRRAGKEVETLGKRRGWIETRPELLTPLGVAVTTSACL